MNALLMAMEMDVNFAVGMRVKWRRWRVLSTMAMLTSVVWEVLGKLNERGCCARRGGGEDYLCLVLWLFVAMLRLLLLLLGETRWVEVWLQKPCLCVVLSWAC